MDLWDVDAIAETDSPTAPLAELAGLELIARAVFSLEEARIKVFRRHDDDE